MTVSKKRLVADLAQLVRIPSWQECDTIALTVWDEATGPAGGTCNTCRHGRV